jgi:hypothetical protein
MPNIKKGIFSGFIATLALTLIMIMKNKMGIMPELDPVHMLASMAAQRLGIEVNLMIGWAMHFVIGSVAWGGALSLLIDVLPGESQVMKGLMVGIIAWLMMMIGPMPMSGAGLFGLNLNMMVPVMTLALHLVFGFVLGFTYKILDRADRSSLG